MLRILANGKVGSTSIGTTLTKTLSTLLLGISVVQRINSDICNVDPLKTISDLLNSLASVLQSCSIRHSIISLDIEFLYKWRELRTLIFLNLKRPKLSISKFYQLCTCKSCDFTPNLEVIAQKTCLPRPWEVLSSQGRGRLIFQAKTSKFGEKL